MDEFESNRCTAFYIQYSLLYGENKQNANFYVAIKRKFPIIFLMTLIIVIHVSRLDSRLINQTFQLRILQSKLKK